MFGEEKLVNQTVYLQQSLATEAEPIAIDAQKATGLKCPEWLGEPGLNIHAEFPLEIRAADPAELELEHHFTDETFF
jgi:hypothetical protein